MTARFLLFLFTISLASISHSASLQFLDDSKIAVTSLFAGEQAVIRVEGLSPNALVSLRCGRGASVSQAVFIASAEGAVDLSSMAPLSGTYSGIDADGMWWSRVDNASVPVGTAADPFTCLVEQEGKEIARGSLTRVYRSPGVSAKMLTVAQDGLLGRFAVPLGQGSFPTLILLGGSEGGLGTANYADYFASKGYATLALAYFSGEGLPPNLDRIPLEYFAKALAWLKMQPQVQADRIGVIGTSRGGELALLLGSRFPEIKAVVSNVGSGLIWAGGWDEQAQRVTSSWTWQGKELPFMPIPYREPDKITLPDGRVADDIASLFIEALKDPTPQTNAAIEAEKIQGPILFLAGADDHIWPSCLLGQLVFDRLRAKGHAYADEFHCYPNAGHWIDLPGSSTTDLTFEHPVFHDLEFFGGTPLGTAQAQRKGWSEILKFIETHLISR